MQLKNNQVTDLVKPFFAAIQRVTGWAGGEDDLAAERAAYAEIGRIVAIPFSVANVYERFAAQVSKIIPFDLISITQLDLDRDTFTVSYTLGMDIVGLGQGKTVSLKDSVVSEVASSQRALITGHNQGVGAVSQTLVDAGLVSGIATPLIANEKIVGTLHLCSRKPNAYGNPELARLEIVGNQIAGAIASGILLQSERDRTSQLRSLYDFAAIINQPLSFEIKAQRIVDALLLILEADLVVLRRGDEEQKCLTLVASSSEGSMEFQQSLELTVRNSATREAYVTGNPILAGDYVEFSDAQPALLAQGVKSMYFLPIKSGDRTLGSLSLASKTPNRFGDGHVGIISAFSNEIGTLFESDHQNENLRESRSELEALSRELAKSNEALETHYLVSQAFSETGHFNNKAKAALDILIAFTGADWATFRLAKPPESGLHLAAAAGPAVAQFPPMQLLTDAQTTSTAAFNEGRIIVTDDYGSLPEASQTHVDMGMKSFVFLPIRVGERSVGLITVISKKKSAFDPEVVALLTFVTDRLGLVVENSLLHDASERSHRDMQQLAEALTYLNQQINESNHELEDRVQARTQELEAARERAMRSEKLAIIGQLSGGIAHDLRNLLGAINNAAYLARRKFNAEWSTDNKEKIIELLHLIDGEIVRANNVISNLLSFGSDKEIVFSKVQISDIISDAIASFVLPDDIDISISVEPSLPPVWGDASHLIRALENLVANARDAMGNGGKLSILARQVDSSVEIVVADTGIGIEQENIGKIFDPLYSGKLSGTGLGLAICHEIISKHHGMITV
jgi:signal transduction histidine kinase